MKPFNSFRNMLGISLALIALLPLSIFGWGTLYYVQQKRIEEIKTEYLFMATEAAMDVSVFLQNEIQTLHAITEMQSKKTPLPLIVNTLRAFNPDNSSGFEAILSLNQDKHVEQVLFSTYRDNTSESLLDFDFSRNNLFQHQIPPGELRYSNVHLSPLSGQLTVSVALATGNGFLFANMALDRVQQIFARFAENRYAEFAILDHNGTLIAHTDRQLLGQRRNYHSHIEVSRGIRGEEGLWFGTHPGKNRLEGVIKVPDSNWMSWVSIDLDRALAVNTKIQEAMYLLTAAILTLAGILAAYFRRLFYRPINRLKQYAKKIGAGEFSHFEHNVAFDEFSDLATSISDMAALLKEREVKYITEKSRFENIMQASPLGMILIEPTTDDSLLLQAGNPAAEAIFETEINATIGNDLYTALPELATSEFLDYLRQVANNHEVWEPMELTIQKKSGEKTLEALAFKTDKDTIACTFKDISARKIRENESLFSIAGAGLLAEVSAILDEAEYGYGEIYNVCRTAIGRLTEFIGAERSHLLLPSEYGTALTCVAAWCKEGVPLGTGERDTVPIEHFPGLVENLSSGVPLRYSNPEQLPTVSGLDKVLLKQPHVRSMLLIPLRLTGANQGALTLQTVAFDREWSEADSSLAFQIGARLIRAIERETFTLSLQQRENQYRRLNLEFQTILRGIRADITLWSADRKLLWSNVDEGRHSPNRFIHCFEPGEHGDKCEDCLMDKCLQHLKPLEQLIRRDERVWGVKFFPIQDEISYTPRVICMATDVTDKMQRREASERSSRLASLGQIAAGVAHEINNPNALILLNASIIKDVIQTIQPMLDERFEKNGDFKLGKLSYSRLRTRLPDLITDLETSAKRIKSIVNDMKGYISRSEMLQSNDLNLNEIVQTALALVINTTKTTKETIQFEMAAGLPKISGNFQRLEQVIINLVINALQSLPEAGCRVFVKTEWQQEAKTISLTIRDEGIGIPEEQLAQIADPFFTTKRETGGTGLGLSVSANIIKDHGGLLFFDSVLNEGTTATVQLPLNT